MGEANTSDEIINDAYLVGKEVAHRTPKISGSRPLTKLHPQTASRVRCIRWFCCERRQVFLRENMTNEPFAYAAVAMDASESTYVTTSREQAEAACREYGWQLVPLYAGPTFTAAERDAVAFASERLLSSYVEEREIALTLRGILDRLQ